MNEPTTERDPISGNYYCIYCGHLEHDPGSCDAIGHRMTEDGRWIAGECTCEIHDDEAVARAAGIDAEVSDRMALAAAIQSVGLPMQYVHRILDAYDRARLAAEKEQS